MSEPRKNHLSIDGGLVKEDDHVASYKPIPDSDTEIRTSKSNLSKSKEKVSPDGAEEKLLAKEDEAKIVRVDMADAKYVVGDHRNGDAKIELDANKRQFSGLTKEELMKYADDPFWVNLRWIMFVLFWAMWLAMLGGAIAIIVKAPKCAPPTPRQWFEKWPLAETDGSDLTWTDSQLETELAILQSASVQGIFVEVPTYDALDKPDVLENFAAFVKKAKEFSIKVIVDLTPNFVSIDHPWFVESANRSAAYSDYFVWAPGKEYDSTGAPQPPSNWVSTLNESAWSWSAARGEFYLHQYGVDQPDLNFNNGRVVEHFLTVLHKWVTAGAAGVRLNKARQMLVNSSLANEIEARGRGSALGTDQSHYAYYRHRHTSDQPQLGALLERFAAAVAAAAHDDQYETVFTLREEGEFPELFLLDRNITSLRPPAAAPVRLRDVTAAAAALTARLHARWPAVQLKTDYGADVELALFAMLLPATPVLSIAQLPREANDTTLRDLVSLREDASLEHGNHSILAVRAGNYSQPQLIACARWKAGHTGYVAVLNPTEEELRANLTGVPTLPATLTVHHVSPAVRQYTNYTKNFSEDADKVLVPPKSTVVLSYVPQTSAES